MDRGVKMKQPFVHYIKGFIRDWLVQINSIIFWHSIHTSFRQITPLIIEKYSIDVLGGL